MPTERKFEDLFDDKEDFKASRKKRVGGYVLGSLLGEGSFAKVRLGSHIMTRERVAIKVINKRLANRREYVRKNMRREAVLLQKLDHPNIARLYEVLETDNSFYIVMELAEGGNFLKFINRRRQLSEHEARKFMRQVVSAVDHMHRSGVLHRDLKIENLMLDRHNDIKIIDFGLSNTWDGTTLLDTQCGSPAYSAPEIFSQKQYGPAVDVWSIGVNLYAMMTGNLPFTVDPPNNLTKLHAQILRGCKVPDYLSTECQDLISRMLEPADHRRITIPEIISHSWINADEGAIRRYDLKAMLTNDEINTAALSYMLKRLDLSEADIRKIIINRRHNATTAIYHLLCQRLQRGVGLPDRVCLDNVEKGRAESVYKQMRKHILDASQNEIAATVTIKNNVSAVTGSKRYQLPSVPSQNLRSASGALAVAGSDIEGDIEMEERGVETQQGLPRISGERYGYKAHVVLESSPNAEHRGLRADGMLTSKPNNKGDYKNYLKELQKQRKRHTQGRSILKNEKLGALKAVHIEMPPQKQHPSKPIRVNTEMNLTREKSDVSKSDVSDGKSVRFNEKQSQMNVGDTKRLTERFVIRRFGEDNKPPSQSRYSDFSESVGTLSRESSGASYAKQRAKALQAIQTDKKYPTPPPPPNSALGYRKDSQVYSMDSGARAYKRSSPKTPVFHTRKPSTSLDTKENTFYESYRFKFRGTAGERSSSIDISEKASPTTSTTANVEVRGPALGGRSRTMPDLRTGTSSHTLRKLATVQPERKLSRSQAKDQVQFRKLGVYYTMPDSGDLTRTRPRKQISTHVHTSRQKSSSIGGRPYHRPTLAPGDVFREITDNVKTAIHIPH